MEVILYIFAFLMMLIGLSTTIRAIIYHIYCGKLKKDILLLVCLKGDNSQMLIRSTAEQMNFWGCKSAVAVDFGVDSEDLECAKLLCDDFNIPLIKKDELLNYIKKNK